MTTTTFDLFVDPLPPPAQALAAVPASVTAFTQILTLSKTSPIFKVVFAQTRSDRDIHQFSVFFTDGRQWSDSVELLPGDPAYEGGAPIAGSPSITRQSQGDTFTATEWRAVEQIALSLLAMHNALGEPSLIQFSFATGSTQVVLDAAPVTATHAVGTLGVNWISPGVGHQDWIGLFSAGTPNTAYLAYQFVPDGETLGSASFATPTAPGTYEFRYLPANGYTSVAVSAPVVVS